jgi:hypothetical protein
MMYSVKVENLKSKHYLFWAAQKWYNLTDFGGFKFTVHYFALILTRMLFSIPTKHWLTLFCTWSTMDLQYYTILQTDADYWLLTEGDVSITDIWKTARILWDHSLIFFLCYQDCFASAKYYCNLKYLTWKKRMCSGTQMFSYLKMLAPHVRIISIHSQWVSHGCRFQAWINRRAYG